MSDLSPLLDEQRTTFARGEQCPLTVCRRRGEDHQAVAQVVVDPFRQRGVVCASALGPTGPVYRMLLQHAPVQIGLDRRELCTRPTHHGPASSASMTDTNRERRSRVLDLNPKRRVSLVSCILRRITLDATHLIVGPLPEIAYR